MCPSRTQAAEPLRGMSIGASSVQVLTRGSYLWTNSIPSPSSRTAPPDITQIKWFRTFGKHAVNTQQFIYMPNMYNFFFTVLHENVKCHPCHKCHTMKVQRETEILP